MTISLFTYVSANSKEDIFRCPIFYWLRSEDCCSLKICGNVNLIFKNCLYYSFYYQNRKKNFVVLKSLSCKDITDLKAIQL